MLVSDTYNNYQLEQLSKKRLNENPDSVSDDKGKYLTKWFEGRVYPFIYIKDNDTLYLGPPRKVHEDIIRSPDFPLDYEKSYSGRIWLDKKYIAFWTYPDPETFIEIIDELEIQFNSNQIKKVEIWDDPEFKVELHIREVKDKLGKGNRFVHPKEYIGSESPPKEEQQHILSPIEKKNRSVPSGVGSKRYQTKRPLSWRQAMVSEHLDEESL